MTEGEFKTANLALAAYLAMEKMEPVNVAWEDGTCFWHFKESSELQSLVTQFSGGQARVDPRAYSYKITQFRKEMRGNNK